VSDQVIDGIRPAAEGLLFKHSANLWLHPCIGALIKRVTYALRYFFIAIIMIMMIVEGEI